ncbi:SigE family RNA polymerase sigma factor [Luteococcus sp. Sow4_B9]|uniref:SigE family RNA polymerase sigma factor n=1 Tax=Luteococcus sp. Sow4_B9 TaxID=3438792 RepID=UPI003F9B3F86
MTEEEFDAFYTASYARVVGQIHAMCGNWAEAQDCTQEAFVRAWDRRGQLDRNDAPEAWVRTVAYRLAVSRWRKARRAFRQPDRAVEDRHPQEPDANRVLLERALAQLPEEQRRAIVLHHLCDMGIDDIAAETGSPTGTVKARLSRGRAALARILAVAEDRGE